MTPIILKILGTLIYMALEYWLGKTNKTAAGSVPELILNIVKSLLSKGDSNASGN